MGKEYRALSWKRSTESDIVLCVGDPDCSSAHVYLLDRLQEMAGSLIPAPTPLSTRTVGNLGEFIAFCAGEMLAFGEFKPFPANAFTPLANISRPDIDILWLFFGEEPREDLALVQEVKTTGDPSMEYASELLVDYEKLFAVDPKFTLQTRLQAIKNALEFTMGRKDLCPRVDRIVGTSPLTSPKVRLIPTAVHEMEGSNPLKRMTAIRSALLSRGWAADAVEPWSISVSDLNSRLERLAQGQV